MLNWIKNLFTSKPKEPVVLDSTTNWPFPTAEAPVAANSTTYEEQAKPVAKPKTQAKKPATTKSKATTTKKAAPKTASKKPAAIKAEPAKRGRKPKSAAGA